MASIDPKRKESARERILAAAEVSVLDKGFEATSIEELIASAGITKSGFFYHFRDKTELARALLVRYVDHENALFDEIFDRADTLSEDPLHGFLVALRMLAELMENLPKGHPGCLVASYCYQDRLFDQTVRDPNAAAVLTWRCRFRARLDSIAEQYPQRIAADLDDVADNLSAVVDGGIILSKVLKDRMALSRQVMLYREFVRAMFMPAALVLASPEPRTAHEKGRP